MDVDVDDNDVDVVDDDDGLAWPNLGMALAYFVQHRLLCVLCVCACVYIWCCRLAAAWLCLN